MSQGFFAHDRLKRRVLRPARSESSFAGEDQRPVVTALAKIRLRRAEKRRLTAPPAKFFPAIFVAVHHAPAQRDPDSFPPPSGTVCSARCRMLSPARR